MLPIRIQAVVEGESEVTALPKLLHCIQRSVCGGYEIVVPSPLKYRRTQITRPDILQRAAEQAARRGDAVLIVFDADDLCPKINAQRLLSIAQSGAGSRPCALVMANREYEAWLLASAVTTAGVDYPDDPDSPRDAKGRLAALRGPSGYMPSLDQTDLTSLIDVTAAVNRSRSFRKLAKEVTRLITVCASSPAFQ